MNTKTLADENGKRKISDRSLENLKLGAEARNKNKERTNLTLLPETVRWLKGWGNASEKVDELVAEARRIFLQPTLPIQDQGAEVERLKARVKDLEQQLNARNHNPFSPRNGVMGAVLCARLKAIPSKFNEQKVKPEFIEWSQAKDPDGIPWYYDQAQGLFYQLPPSHIINSFVQHETQDLKRLCDMETERANEAVRDGLKAAKLLHQALTLKANAGGAIKSKIKEALKFIDDI